MKEGPHSAIPQAEFMATLRERARQAIERARFKVYPVPIAGKPGYFTLATEAEAVHEAGFDEERARRYASAINNEAELARAMIIVLAEYERLTTELAAARGELDTKASTPES